MAMSTIKRKKIVYNVVINLMPPMRLLPLPVSRTSVAHHTVPDRRVFVTGA
jgi:hypothetical protein